MNTFKITLTLSFKQFYWDEDWRDENKTKAKKAAFDRTDTYYEEHDIIHYIKSFDAMCFVESLFASDGEIRSAEWDEKKFQLHVVFHTNLLEEEILEELSRNSLEDGEYEACCDSGWKIYTRGPHGEVFNGPFKSGYEFWEYGLTDYRMNPVKIVRIED